MDTMQRQESFTGQEKENVRKVIQIQSERKGLMIEKNNSKTSNIINCIIKKKSISNFYLLK